MRRPTVSASGLEGLLPYALVGVSTVIFWGVTLLLWQLASREIETAPPNFALTLFALPLPFLGYWALQSSPAAQGRPFRPLAYVGIEVLALIFWSIAVWLWLQAYIWYAFVTDLTFILIFLLMLLPYVTLIRSFEAVSAPPAPAPSPPPANPGPSGSTPPPVEPRDLTSGWLRWLGSGEPKRGVLVILVLIFWSMLYWNWPEPDIRALPLSLTFPAWGLITIFGLVAIRAMFFRQTNLPSQEVSAGDSKKSGP